MGDLTLGVLTRYDKDAQTLFPHEAGYAAPVAEDYVFVKHGVRWTVPGTSEQPTVVTEGVRVLHDRLLVEPPKFPYVRHQECVIGDNTLVATMDAHAALLVFSVDGDPADIPSGWEDMGRNEAFAQPLFESVRDATAAQCATQEDTDLFIAAADAWWMGPPKGTTPAEWHLFVKRFTS